MNQKYVPLHMDNTYVHVHVDKTVPQLFIDLYSFTCAAVLQTQYKNLTQLAGFGNVKNVYIKHGKLLEL